MEPDISTKESALYLQPFALLLPLSEPGLCSLDLLAVPLPLLLPALLLLPVLRLQLVEAGKLFSLQGQSPLLLLLQQHVPSVAAGQGCPLCQRGPLQLNVTVLLRYDGLKTGEKGNYFNFVQCLLAITVKEKSNVLTFIK